MKKYLILVAPLLLALLSACTGSQEGLVRMSTSSLTLTVMPGNNNMTLRMEDIPDNAVGLNVAYRYRNGTNIIGTNASFSFVGDCAAVADGSYSCALSAGISNGRFIVFDQLRILYQDGTAGEVRLIGKNDEDNGKGGIYIGPNNDGDERADDVDDDDDNDGIKDDSDNCHFIRNPLQNDTDGDAQGDACDEDDDGDGLLDAADAGQAENGTLCRLLSDCDGDNVTDNEDPFRLDASEWRDTDADGIGNNSDNCVQEPNPLQNDTDGDAQGDVCDDDDDGDGLSDAADTGQAENGTSCSLLSDCDGDNIADDQDLGMNATTRIPCKVLPDCDEDNVADDQDLGMNAANEACKVRPDCDGDGIRDDMDNCPLQPNPAQEDENDNGRGDVCDATFDSDMDGVVNLDDLDEDGDGLIEISTAAQLDQVRYVLNGTGVRENATADINSTGCPVGGCIGYELRTNISLGAYIRAEMENRGWQPIGNDGGDFTAVFEGNNFTIAGLFIDRPREDDVGLFGKVRAAEIRNLRLRAERIEGGNRVGALVGNGSASDISFSSVWVDHISGMEDAGGLVGFVEDARIYAAGVQLGSLRGGRHLGGLIGRGSAARLVSSYAQAGSLEGTGDLVAGLIGAGRDTRVISSYAQVESIQGGRDISGLMGMGDAASRIISSYAQTDNLSGDAIYGLGNMEPTSLVEASYWDNATSGINSGAHGLPQDSMDLQGVDAFVGIYQAWSAGGDVGDPAINITRWCDRDLSGTIDANEQRNETRLWDLGNSSQYPILHCSLDGARAQREASLHAADCGASEASSCALRKSGIGAPNSRAEQLGFAGDRDYFRIEVVQPGMLSVETQGELDTIGELYAAAGLIARDDNSGAGNNFKLSARVSPGYYSIRVRGTDDAQKGDYVLRTSSDCGDTIRETHCTMSPTDSLQQAYDFAGDRDLVRLELDETGRLSVWTEGERGSVGRLWSAKGALLATAEGAGANFNITYSLRAGTYYIDVRGDDGDQSGSYAIKTSFSPQMDCGDNRQTGCSLGLMDTFLEYMNDTDGDVFHIRVEAAGTLILQLSAGGSLAGGLENDAVEKVDPTPESSDNRGSVYNLTPGDYYFEVSSTEGVTFSYTLVSSFFPTDDDCGGNVCTIDTNGSAAGIIAVASDVDTYQVEIMAEGILVAWTEGALDTRGTFFNSSDNVLVADENSGPADNFRLIGEISSPGTYFINISATTIGPYQLFTRFSISPDERSYYCQDLEDGESSPGAGGDPLLHYQWYLDRIGVKSLWSRSQGEGVHISILDDALQLAHPDLQANILPGLSRNYLATKGQELRNNPLPIDCALDAHGTAVMGIVAGVGDNGIGIKGVAPRAGIYFSNVLQSRTGMDLYEAFGDHTNATAVSSNSWGPIGWTRLRPQDKAELEVMEAQLEEGYGGMGISYVFAAGNERVVEPDEVLGTLANNSEDMASYEERLNFRGVIPVCAVTSEDEYASYSNPGINLWICAPSANGTYTYFSSQTSANRSFFGVTPYYMTTTDLTGRAGYNEGYSAPPVGERIKGVDLVNQHLEFGGGGFWIGVDRDFSFFPVVHPNTPNVLSDRDCRSFRNGCYIEVYKQPGDSSYHRFFSGTSAAAPVVSGVIALLRAAHPQLSWRDIKLILAESAEQVDAEASFWQPGATAYGNAEVSYMHSIDYGFGLINATGAMEVADEWMTRGLLPPEKKYEHPQQQGTIGTVFQVTIPADSVDFIEYTQLYINSSHENFGELKIVLESPASSDGRTIKSTFTRHHECALAPDESNCADLAEGFTFGSAAHLGAAAAGEWTLRINPLRGEDVPISWQLRFYGHNKP